MYWLRPTRSPRPVMTLGVASSERLVHRNCRMEGSSSTRLWWRGYLWHSYESCRIRRTVSREGPPGEGWKKAAFKSRNVTGCYHGYHLLVRGCHDRCGHPERKKRNLSNRQPTRRNASGCLKKGDGRKVKVGQIESRLIHGLEVVASSPWLVKKMTEAIFDNQCFIAPLATNVKNETKKAGDVESKIEVLPANASIPSIEEALSLHRRAVSPRWKFTMTKGTRRRTRKC